MSKEAEIEKMNFLSRQTNMAKIRKLRGSCISGVSVLQNMTLNAESRQFMEKMAFLVNLYGQR